VSDDPDALWKPGYEGGFRTLAPEPASGTGRARRSGRLVVVFAVAVVAIVGTAIALVVPARDDGEPVLTQPWSVTFGGTTMSAPTVGHGSVVALVGRPASVVTLDIADGSERWRRSAPGDSATGLDVVSTDEHGAVVLIRHVDADGSGSVLALDLVTGAVLWRWALAVGERLEVADAELRRESVRATVNGSAGTQRIDPATGGVTTDLGPDDAAGPASDNVLRSWGTASGEARSVIEVSGGLVTVLVDPSIAAATISFEPTSPG
jgi:outer membrane protein assembly factor BamB